MTLIGLVQRIGRLIRGKGPRSTAGVVITLDDGPAEA